MERYEDPDRAKKYQYRSDNRSLLDAFVYKHWWPIALRFVPEKAPANLVSIVGNVGAWTAFLLLASFGRSIELSGKPGPSWIFAIAGLCLFFYQTLDALDGMQARRTGSAGPLGEYIDHWFDAINVFLIPLGFALAFPSLPAWLGIGMVFMAVLSDWAVLRETKETNLLVFGPISTEEVLASVQVFYLAIWAFGYDFWSIPRFGSLSLAYIVAIGAVLLFTAATAGALLRMRFKPLADLAAEAVSLAPVLAASVAARERFGFSGGILGGLALGFFGALYTGDLLRSRLVGLWAPRWYPGLFLASLAPLAALVIPGLPVPLLCVLALGWLLALLYSLITRFKRTLDLIDAQLGIGLFDLRPQRRVGND